MGTVIERVEYTAGGWRQRHSALRLAVGVAKTCLREAGVDTSEVDLLVNAGIYRDRNLAEPALAAIIQHDIRANPGGPQVDSHGTFSFDVANGSCGILTGLQIVDGFLRSRSISRALIVAADADPGRRSSVGFPFSPSAAALLCRLTDDDGGMHPVHWERLPDDGATFRATISFDGKSNLLRVERSEGSDASFAEAAERAIIQCLSASRASFDDVAAVAVAPGSLRADLAGRLGLDEQRIFVARDVGSHTASLASAFGRAVEGLAPGDRLLLVAAGGGVAAGAALYEVPPKARVRSTTR